jgi:CheY-like chemotaxis protein
MSGAPEDKVASAPRRVEMSALRFLCADANAYMRRIYRMLLIGLGARELVTVEDGDAAIEAVRIHAPDIVILDWTLPGKNGFDVSRAIRGMTEGDPFIPIIMCTARASMQSVIDARDAGVNDFLVKPLSANKLRDRVVAALANPRPFVQTESFAGPDRRRNRNTSYSGPEKRSADAAAPVAARAMEA